MDRSRSLSMEKNQAAVDHGGDAMDILHLGGEVDSDMGNLFRLRSAPHRNRLYLPFAYLGIDDRRLVYRREHHAWHDITVALRPAASIFLAVCSAPVLAPLRSGHLRAARRNSQADPANNEMKNPFSAKISAGPLHGRPNPAISAIAATNA